MPRKFIKRHLPDREIIRGHRQLRLFGQLLHEPNLWHLNRRSAAGAFAVGVFVAFIPFPFQMVMAAAAAIVSRVNLTLSVLLVWITNPVTIPPMYYSAYRMGAWLMGIEARPIHFELSLSWAMEELTAVWRPLLLGCLVLGTLAASGSYFLVRGLWQLHLVRHIRRRRRTRRDKRDGD